MIVPHTVVLKSLIADGTVQRMFEQCWAGLLTHPTIKDMVSPDALDAYLERVTPPGPGSSLLRVDGYVATAVDAMMTGLGETGLADLLPDCCCETVAAAAEQTTRTHLSRVAVEQQRYMDGLMADLDGVTSVHAESALPPSSAVIPPRKRRRDSAAPPPTRQEMYRAELRCVFCNDQMASEDDTDASHLSAVAK